MRILNRFIIIIFLFFNAVPLPAQQKSGVRKGEGLTYITGKIERAEKQDTLALVLHGQFFFDGPSELGARKILKAAVDTNGKFIFKITSAGSPFHVSLFLSSKKGMFGYLWKGRAVADYLIEPGDSINIVFKNGKQHYSGRGANLFSTQYRLEQVDKNEIQLKADPNDYFHNDSDKWLFQKDSILRAKLEVLSADRLMISPLAFSIIRADIIGVNRSWVYRCISVNWPAQRSGKKLSPNVASLCRELENRAEYISQKEMASLSPKYIDYLYKKLVVETKYKKIINNSNPSSNTDSFAEINRQYSGTLRDKLLAFWLTSVASINHLEASYIDSCLSVMQNPVFIKIVQDLKKTYGKGMPVTDFDFKDSKGNIVRLADFKGKVLFIDMWFSGCSNCIAVAEGLPSVEKAFENRTDVAFLSISIDKDRNTWLKSINKNHIGKRYTHYTTPNTIYLYTSGTASDNPFIKTYVPQGGFPSLLIIDKSGRIFSSTPASPVNEQGKKELIKEITQALVTVN